MSKGAIWFSSSGRFLRESQFTYQGIVLIGQLSWRMSFHLHCPDLIKNNISYPDKLICDPECGVTEICKEIDLQIRRN